MTPTEIEDAKVYYFGNWGQPGHYLFNSQRQGVRGDGEIPSIFNARNLDARWCRNPGAAWKGDEPEGLAYLHHVEIQAGDHMDAPFIGSKWTVLAFADRSGDERNGSNSAFISDGVHTFQQMILLARSHFPDIWKRMTSSFDIVDIKTIK